MPKDFRSSQVRTGKLIASGSESATGTPSLLVYSASDVSGEVDQYAGSIPTRLLRRPGTGTGKVVGKDVWIFVSGTQTPVGRNKNEGTTGIGVYSSSIGGANTATLGYARRVLFGGDVVVSGTLYAERQVIEVDETIQGFTYVSGSAVIEDSFTANEAGGDFDSRIESNDETHMFFVDAGNNRISIGDSVDAPTATLEITNNASAGAFGVPLVQLNSNDVDKVGLDINAANTTANVLDIAADALTTGKALNITSDSSSTSARSLVDIKNDNTAAVGTKLLSVINDAIASDAGQTVLIKSTAAETYPLLELQNANAATDKPPILTLNRSNTQAYADDMTLGIIDFRGSNSGNTSVIYGQIDAIASDITATDTGGLIKISVLGGGIDGNSTLIEAISIGGEDTANGTPCEVVINEGSANVDFRIESNDETHMVFVDAGNNRVSVGDSVDAPAATLEITNNASAGATGVPLVKINSNDVDQVALFVNAANTTEDVIQVTADAVTTANIMDVTADALTTGNILNLVSNSPDTNSNKLVKIHNDHASAVATTALFILNDAVASNITAVIESTAAETNPLLELKNSNVATDKPPILSLRRADSSAEADDMKLGTIDFRGANASNANTTYAQIEGIASDVTNGDVGGLIKINVKGGGTAGLASTLEALSIGGEDVANATACEVVVNEGSADIDFRVETDGEDEALVVDAGANTLWINKGETAFTTIINNITDEVMRVDSLGVIFNEDGHANVDFRVESDSKTHALFVDAGNNRVLIHSGGSAHSVHEASGTDVNFYVSGTVGGKLVDGTAIGLRSTSLFGGDLVVSGGLHAAEYIYHDTDPDTFIQFGADSIGLSAGGVSFVNITEAGHDGIVFNEGNADINFRVESLNRSRALYVDGGNNVVNILAGSESETTYADTAFYVSGTVGSKDSTTKGTSIFGGDLVVSGNAHIGGSAAGQRVLILSGGAAADTNFARKADVSFFVSGTKLARGSASGGVAVFGGDIVASGNINANAALAVSEYIKHQDDGDTYIRFTNDAINFNAGGVDFLKLSEASAGTPGDVAVFNEDGADVDFRVESSGEDEAIFLDAGSNALYINKGGTAFSTIIANTNDEAFRVGAEGVTVNEDGHTAVDFRVETNNKTHALFVDAGADQVLIHSGGSAHSAAQGVDINFFVSGTVGGRGAHNGYGASLFGGDLIVSGNIVAGGTLLASEYIKHDLDPNTFIRFQADSIDLQAGGIQLLTLTEDGSQDEVVVNEGSEDVNFRVETNADDNAFKVDSGNNVVVINDDGEGNTDFRVETGAEDEAFFIDSSANTVYINKGESAVVTSISNTNDEALRVGAQGVIINEDANAAVDFRVESDNKPFSLFVDAGNDRVLIHSGGDAASTNEATASDVNFYVSGTVGSQNTAVKGTSVFGGDTVISGGLYLGTRIYNNGDTDTYIRPRTNRWQVYAGGFEAMDIRMDTTPKRIEINGGKEDIDFQVGSDNNGYAIFVDASTDRVMILSGGAATDTDPLAGQDVSFYVSGAIGSHGGTDKGVTLFTGDTFISGVLRTKNPYIAVGGLSGSLTKLTDGTSYLIAGSGVTIATGSSGAVTITAAGVDATNGADNRIATFSDSDSLNGEANLTFDGSTFTATGDSSLNGAVTVNESGADKDFRVESSNKTHALFVDGGTDQVLILSGGAATSADAAAKTDINFFVSGTVGSQNVASSKGTALFGGDLVVSGVLAAAMGLTGSLTRLKDGTSYLIAGADTTITSASNGAITIASSLETWTRSGAGRIYTSTDADKVNIGGGNAEPGGKVGIKVADSENIDGLFIDFNETGGKNALEIDSESTSGMCIKTYGFKALYAKQDITNGYAGFFTRDINEAGSNPLVGIHDNHAANEQAALQIRQDGTGDILRMRDGADIIHKFKDGGAVYLGSETAAGVDVSFHVSGSVGLKNGTTAGIASFGGDLVASGNVYLATAEASKTVYILSGGSASSVNEAIPNDISFYVSGAIGGQGQPGVLATKNGTSLFGGDLVVSGNIHTAEYIYHEGDSDTYLRFTDNSVKIQAANAAIISYDNSETSITFNADEAARNTLIKTANKMAFAAKNATDQVLILSGGSAHSANEADGIDINFYVSGAVGSQGTAARGSSLFGGDLVVSGGFKVDDTTLVVDQANSKVGIGTAVPGYNFDVVSSTTPQARILNNANNSYGGILRLENNRGGSANGAVDDFAGGTVFIAPDSAANATQYAKISSNIVSPTNGAEVGSLTFETTTAIANHGIPLFMRADRVHVLSGGAASSLNEAAALDVALYISGTVGSRGTSTRGATLFGGDAVVSGSLSSGMGLSGSLTRLKDGTSYLIAGSNVTISSASNGAVTIAATGGGGGLDATNGVDNRIATFTDSDSLNGEANLTFDGSTFTTTGDSSLNGSVVINDAGATKNFRVETNNKTHAVYVNGTTDQVLMLSGGSAHSTDEAAATDINFYVSGTVGSQNIAASKGTSLFGGDTYVSGTLRAYEGISGSLTQLLDGTSYLVAGSNVTITTGSSGAVTIAAAAGGIDAANGADNRIATFSDSDSLNGEANLTFDGNTLTAANSSNTATSAVTIDRNYTGTTNIGNYTTDPQGLLIDYDVTGIVASGQTAIHDAIAINYNQDGPTMVGTVNATGADIRMTGGTSGTQSMKGVAITLAGADTNIGVDVTAPNDSTHFIARSSDSILDYCSISVGASGATTLSTNDAGGSVGHLTLDADGKIIINALAGKEVVFNEANENVDFRVESNNSTHAFFVDAGTDQVLFMSGGSASSIDYATMSDTLVHFSGSRTEVGTPQQNTTGRNQGLKSNVIFSGDVVMSGTIYAGSEINPGNPVLDFSSNTHRVTTTKVAFADLTGVVPGLQPFQQDVFFGVSGSIGGKANPGLQGSVAVFGGDTVISGSAWIGNMRSVSADAQPLGRMTDGEVVIHSSDRRIKTDFEDITSALDMVKNLKGIYYSPKPGFGDSTKRYIGFVAQDVEKVVPELAYTNPQSEMMGVRYSDTVALLTEAIKEMATEIDRLKLIIEDKN